MRKSVSSTTAATANRGKSTARNVRTLVTRGEGYISHNDASMTELIRAVPCACVRLWKRKGEGKRIENENERNRDRERERIGISGREGVANVQATTGGAFQSQHDETKAEAIGEDWLMRDVRAENDDNYATRDTNCPRAVSLSTEERMYPLVPLSPCLFTLFLSLTLSLSLFALFLCPFFKEKIIVRLAFIDGGPSFTNTRDETRLPLPAAIYQTLSRWRTGFRCFYDP